MEKRWTESENRRRGEGDEGERPRGSGGEREADADKVKNGQRRRVNGGGWKEPGRRPSQVIRGAPAH